MTQTLSKDGRIAAVVKKKAAAGVPVREIFASIRNYQYAPKSINTFYKYYKDVIDEARGTVTETIANKLIAKAYEGDFKSQELWLTTKGGWSRNQTVTNLDVEYNDEEKSNAVETLLSKLGIGDDKKED